jgi:small subunit ribosomal protein S20
MANHKSAQKRSRQTIKKTKINQILLSQLKTSYKKFNSNLNDNNLEVATESLRKFNADLSKALKRRIIKKRTASRKLSSLSDKIKKII